MHGRSLHFEDVIYLKRYFGVRTLTLLHILRSLEVIPQYRYHDFRALDQDAFERSLFGDVSEAEKPGKSRTKLLASERYKVLGVSADQKSEREKSQPRS